MRLYIPDMNEFFAWMERQGYRYVVLRGFDAFKDSYPPKGGKKDIDFLTDDHTLGVISARYHTVKKADGVKCDFYNVTGAHHGGYLGHSYMPPPLAEKVLTERRIFAGRFYVPAAEAHLFSLLYHICYQKAEISGIHIDDASKSMESKYVAELNGVFKETGRSMPYTLTAFHNALKDSGYAITQDVLADYLKNDFMRKKQVKSLFRARLCAEQTGEMNLFVIRKIALKTKTQNAILDKLKSQYEVLTVKEIPFLTRLMKSGHMRGGKWRRGGRPHIAVVVFDPAPQPTTEEDRKIHPYVLNARQFVKRGWRDWFTKETGSKPSANPIHSTDNEAEAIGHLPLFFDAAEEKEIFKKLKERRR